jgi:hypothetical protein
VKTLTHKATRTIGSRVLVLVTATPQAPPAI